MGRGRPPWMLMGLALLSTVVPAAALTQGELRAMHESTEKAQHLQQHRGRRPAIPPHHSSAPVHSRAPPSNLGGHVSKEKGIKQWHSDQNKKAPVARAAVHHSYYTTQHNGAPYVDMQAQSRVANKKPKMGVRVTASGSGDPDTPNSAERERWGGARDDRHQVQVPNSKRMKGEYERESDGRVRVRPQMHHDVLGDYEQRTWSANKDTIIQHAEEQFLKHESPMAVHDCGLDGDDCNYSGTGVEDHDLGTFMKARTQSLAQVSWLPDCSTINCATEIHVQRSKTAAAKQPEVIGSHSSASVQAQLAYNHATDYRWGAAHAAAVPTGAPVQKVELSHKDIDELAKELYQEATAANRNTAESAQVTRAQQIRHAVAAAISKALPMRRVAPTPIVVAVSARAAAGARGRGASVHHARSLHATHRGMLSPEGGGRAAVTVMPQGWPVAGFDPSHVMPHSMQTHAAVEQPVEGAQQSVDNAPMAVAGAVPGEPVVAAGEEGEDGEMEGETGEEGEAGEVRGEAPREEEGLEGNEETGEDEQHMGEIVAAAPLVEEAPLTFLAGACCDAEGNCKKCPGPDEDYNMWDNLYIFPGDETGMGRSFMHVCLAVLLLIVLVLVCTFILDNRKEQTGSHPLDGLYQNVKELGDTTQSSVGDMWKKTFDKKEETEPESISI